MNPRTFAIWVFGILASMTFGGAVGAIIDRSGAGEAVWYGIGGACAFTCARLWAKE
jgi:hypothetical protein